MSQVIFDQKVPLFDKKWHFLTFTAPLFSGGAHNLGDVTFCDALF